jgi:hypothetical protein
MTQLQAEIMIVQTQADECRKAIVSAMAALQRRTAEMADAIAADGTPLYDLQCHAVNVTTAVHEVAILSERFNGLRRLLKLADELDPYGECVDGY